MDIFYVSKLINGLDKKESVFYDKFLFLDIFDIEEILMRLKTGENNNFKISIKLLIKSKFI